MVPPSTPRDQGRSPRARRLERQRGRSAGRPPEATTGPGTPSPKTSTSTSTEGSGREGGATTSRPPIDPRIRARRIEVARGTGRRRLRRLGIALLLVALAAGVWGLAASPLLDVDRIEVSGAGRTGDEVVRAASGVERGDVLATVDLDRTGDRVAELPWVASVVARREWPGTVRIEVEEREAVAAVRQSSAGGEGDGATAAWMLLSADGHQLERVVTPVDEPPPVVILEGVEPDDEPGAVLGAAVGALRSVAVVPDDFRSRVVVLRVVPDGDLEVVVTRPEEAGEIVAQLGPPVDLAEKMVAVATVVDQADLSGATAINVEVPASPVLTREPASE